MKKIKRPALALLLAMLSGAAVSAGVLALFSLLCENIGITSGGAAAAFAVAAACIGSLCAGFFSARINGSRCILIGGAAGLLMFLLLLGLMTAAGGNVTSASLLRLGLMTISGATGGGIFAAVRRDSVVRY